MQFNKCAKEDVRNNTNIPTYALIFDGLRKIEDVFTENFNLYNLKGNPSLYENFIKWDSYLEYQHWQLFRI